MSKYILLNDWKKLRLWGKTLVIVDFGNIYKTYFEQSWIKLFKDSYNFLIKILSKITDEFNSYKVKKDNIYVFVGIDNNIKSSAVFAQKLKEFLGDKNVITKPVKFLKQQDWVVRRKADFDALIGYFTCQKQEEFKTFVFLSSDGDFVDIYESLLKNNKQVVVFHGLTFETKRYTSWGISKKKKKKKYNLGKEVRELVFKHKGKIFTFPLDKLI